MMTTTTTSYRETITYCLWNNSLLIIGTKRKTSVPHHHHHHHHVVLNRCTVLKESSSFFCSATSSASPSPLPPALTTSSLSLSPPPPTTTTTTTTTIAIATKNLPLSPPTTQSSWFARWLHLWDQTSGTYEILQLKEKVNLSSMGFDAKQREVSQARSTLDAAMEAFEHSQLEHSQLLRNRDSWTSSQAYDFAKLLEKEIDIRKELEIAKKNLANLETEQLSSMHTYMNHLRRRYHEEQLWQDKWRVYSTYGTWSLIVLNSIVFLMSQYMTRLRESQRMKDVQEWVHQSMRVNEDMLRAIQDRQIVQHELPIISNANEDRVEKGNDTSQQLTLDTTEIVDRAVVPISKTEATALVSDEGDTQEEGREIHSQATTHRTSSLLSTLQNLWSCGISLIPGKINSGSGASTITNYLPFPSQIQQHLRNFYNYASGMQMPKKKITLPTTVGNDDDDDKMNKNKVEVDVPSAILGASVACVTWLVVNVVTSSLR